ncbi:MAG: hypothetical protein HY737_08025, partial [Candidatus Omnitrophica bacterium]|nr:hypothetical protein [Candidatus Omnitrophota bacterium]
ATASYDAATQTWSFPLAAAHVSPGGQVELWVQAEDQAGNTSAWQRRQARVGGGGPDILGPSRVMIQGTQLLVAKRQEDGRLAAAAPFKLKGVAYSPVDPGETIGSLAAARQHLRESRYKEDFELMQQMGANAIKTYADMGTDLTAIKILNEAYQRNLMVLVMLDIDTAQVTSVVDAYKNHPALLGWLIGNEWNLNRFYRGLTIEQGAAEVERIAQLIHQLDPNHPVASSLGFSRDHLPMPNPLNVAEWPGLYQVFVDILTKASSVDWWGLNAYRGSSLDPLFVTWTRLSAFAGAPKPLFFSEFGTDSWNHQSWQLDEALQADTDTALWDEIHRQLSAADPNHQCVGGFAFEWNDEWWKAPGGSLLAQEPGGFPLSYPVFGASGQVVGQWLGHPDGYSNEEHYGLLDINRGMKQTFHVMREAFSLGWVKQDPVRLEIHSRGFESGGPTVFLKRGMVMARGGAPLSVLTVNRATGLLRRQDGFDVWESAATECPRLQQFVATECRPGDVLLLGVANTANNLTRAETRPCLDALQRLGSHQADQIAFQIPWAMISEISPKGGEGMNLAEAVGQSRTDVARVQAEIFLDADRDGLTDNVDPDNDNDGVSDAAERTRGSDVLDPSS